jgi:hypothetical protein
MVGNKFGDSGLSGGSEIFDFFDDFLGESLDKEKWDYYYKGNASIDQSNGILSIRAEKDSVASADLVSKEAFASPVAVRFGANISAGQINERKGLGFMSANVGSKPDEPGLYICWKGIDSNLMSYHKLAFNGTVDKSSYPAFLKYPMMNRTWQITWLNSSAQFDPNGEGGAHELVNSSIEKMQLRFSLNNSRPTKYSEMSFDWVSMWKCAEIEPKVSFV